MPLAVEIVLVIIGIGLLALALIGSGISRRLMTIPKMRRAPRVVLAVLGVLLLAGGMWGLSIESEERGPSVADLKAHIPDSVKSEMTCTEAAESPKGAVRVDCTGDGVPDWADYTMFPDVNAMQDHWMEVVGGADYPGDQCTTIDDFKTGSSNIYSLEDASVHVGEWACYMYEDKPSADYTDRRFNIIVRAEISNPENVSEFITWLGNSQPEGDDDATPKTPTNTP